MNPEQTRREMEALFPGLEENEALQAAFYTHVDAEQYLGSEPELGRTIPWVLVRCETGGKSFSGLVVGGVPGRHGWDMERPFVVFSTEIEKGGGFVPITPLVDRVSVIGTLPGSVRNPGRPDAVTLLHQIADLTLQWASNRNAAEAWSVWARIHGQPAFPECFVEFHLGDEVLRGLITGGALDRAGGWDFTRPVHLLVWPGRAVTIDPTQADWKEVLHGHEVAQSRRG